MCFTSPPHRRIRFGSLAEQYPPGSEPFCLQATVASICLMMSSCGELCWFAEFASWLWQKVLFLSIDHCLLCWKYWWPRCWMLQDMDHMEASCVFYVKVGMLNWLDPTKICVLTVKTLGIAMLTVHHYMMFSIGIYMISRIVGDIHQHMSFQSINVLYITPKYEISAVVDIILSL